MKDERIYEFDETAIESVEDREAREEATRIAFQNALKEQKRKYILSETGKLNTSIREELLAKNREALEKNGIEDIFSNLVTVAPSKKEVYKIDSKDGKADPIYITSDDELYPVLETIEENIHNHVPREEVAEEIAQYQQILEDRGLSDILVKDHYKFSKIPEQYKILSKQSDTDQYISTQVDYKSSEVFDIVDEYFEHAAQDPLVAANKKLDDFISSDEFSHSYDYIKNTFNALLDTASLNVEQVKKADELFVQMPSMTSLEKTKENEFCFEALKTARQCYQLDPNFGAAWLTLPEQIQKDPTDLAEKTGKRVKSSGNKKIKSKVENVDKMESKDTITKKDSNNAYTMLFNNGYLLPLEQIYEYTNKMSQEEKDEFLNHVDGMNAIYNKDSVGKARKKPGLSLNIFKNIVDNIKYYAYQHRVNKMENKFKLYYKNPFGKNPITVSQLFEEEKENDTPVPLNLLMKISCKAAKELKVTQDAAKKLEENDLENINTDILRLENKYDILQEDKKIEKQENEQKKVDDRPRVAPDEVIIPPLKEEESLKSEIPNTEPVKENKTERIKADEPKSVKENGSSEKKVEIPGDNLRDVVLNIFGSLSSEDLEKMAESKRKEEKASDPRFATYDKYKTRLDQEREMQEIWDEVGAVLDNENFVKDSMKRAEEHTKAHEYRANLEKEAFENSPKRKEVIKKSRVDSLKNKINVATMNDLDLDTLAELNQVVSDTLENKSGKSR